MIDEVLALVDELVACVTQCGFRIFEPAQAAMWASTLEDFKAQDASVQDATMNLINTSFRWACLASPCAHVTQTSAQGSASDIPILCRAHCHQ